MYPVFESGDDALPSRRLLQILIGRVLYTNPRSTVGKPTFSKPRLPLQTLFETYISDSMRRAKERLRLTLQRLSILWRNND